MSYKFLFRDLFSNISLKYIITKPNIDDIKSITHSTNNRLKLNPFVQGRAIERLHSYWTLKRLSSYEIEDLDSITISQEVGDEFEFNYYY